MNLSRFGRVLSGVAASCLLVGLTAPTFAGEQKLIDLRKDRFPFSPPANLGEWESRAEQLRRRVLVANGLWPPPPRPHRVAEVFGAVEREGYTVERFLLESFPGHYVTGSLYRPDGLTSPAPGVLCPHGHWRGGRMHAFRDDELAQQLASGAEALPIAGRYPLQARCVQLARMGCVVLMIDSLGYADSLQLSHDAVHAPTEETLLAEPGRWGLYSVDAELRLQNPLGIQTYNALCALDWLAGASFVDGDRLAVVGASGGATQTMMACAIDPRPSVAFPAVMVSTAMQGGCGCENACCLRMGGASNVAFAALMAPRPLGMTSADDWTRDFSEHGWPELQQVYSVLGASDRVTHASLTQFPHNFNHASRSHMYPWLARWLNLPDSTELEEREFTPLSTEELTVWGPDRPAPDPTDRGHEVALMRAMDEQSRRVMESLTPRDRGSFEEYRRVVGGAFEVLLDRPQGDKPKTPQTQDAAIANQTSNPRPLALPRPNGRGKIEALLFASAAPRHGAVWLSTAGAAGAAKADGQPNSPVQSLLDNGFAVLAVTLADQPDAADYRTPVVPDKRPVAALTYGYNRTLVAQRTADVLTAAASLRRVLGARSKIAIVGTAGTASYACSAAAIGETVDAAAIDTGGFRFDQLTSWRDPHFLPGAVKYGDLPGLLALAAPRPLVIAGEQNPSRLLPAAYNALEAADSLTLLDADATIDDAVRRLIAILTN